ncbi:MAG TPA: methionine adenosyltransferase [Burkholderiales bacterium]|nr:methionine adenosyltransferase [Burkholderiales bacterium]
MHMEMSLLGAPSPGALATEIVERKGTGHPDTICDALAESFSAALSRFYLERFGLILHHNVDKGLLWGGVARPRFGGGEVLQPIEIYLAGRATAAVSDVRVPIETLAIEASRTWLRQHFRHLDPERHVRVHVLVRPTSTDLASLFARQRGTPLANDTSFGVGFAPLDLLERQVLTVERELNLPATKGAHPEIGEDIKVMGMRTADSVRLTVACALIDRYVGNLDDYFQKKAAIARLAAVAARAAGAREAEVEVNPADGATEESVYLTVTGTSAEAGDDGQVGRGNRPNGLITPYRPMSLEAAAGKNPVTHVGKLYSILANRIAQAAVAQLPGAVEAHCFLLSRIGQPIDEPQAVDLKLRLEEPETLGALRGRAEQIVGDALGTAVSLWREIIEGRITLW